MTRVLFMTGTVAPPADTPLLARQDASARIEDYRQALDFYLDVLARGGVDRLVFVENSGHGMAPFAGMAEARGLGPRAELLSYAAPPVGPEGSRLEAEFRLLLHGLAAARTFREVEGATIWKVTGRYIVRNIEAIMAGAPPGCDAHFHCRDYPAPYVDFALAGYAQDRAAEILGLLADGPMGTEYMRWVRAELDHGALARFRISRRHARIPRLSGRRGVDGASWDAPAQRLRWALRAAAAAVAPRLWI